MQLRGAALTREATEFGVPQADGELFLGHPRGLLFLSFTEGWERFSFYGMRALLVLYLVQELLLPGHVENVAGMGAFRAGVEAVFGPLSTQAFASQVFGLYAGLVYLTPIFGGILADRWLGAKRTVMLGIALMTAGHFFMAFEWAVLLALLLLILGSGCLKGNIATQVGRLYPRDDERRRARGFIIFSTGINIGSMIGPVACGLLAQLYGWHVGFSAAGVCMLFAAAIYFAGLRHFVADPPPVSQRAKQAALLAAEWQMIGLITAVLLLTLFMSLTYDQMGNVGMIWISERVALGTPLGMVPPAWFMAEDPLASVLIVPVLFGLWRAQARRGREPGDLGKIATGAIVMAAAPAALALGDWLAGDGPVSIIFPILGFALSGIAFMYYWPTLLGFVAARSPAKVASLMMALTYATAFVSGVGSGFIGRYYEPLGGWQFWVLNMVVALGTALGIMLFGKLIKRQLALLERRAEAETGHAPVPTTVPVQV